jgi:hypothetical protein
VNTLLTTSMLIATAQTGRAQTLTVAVSVTAVNFNLVRASVTNVGNTSVNVTTNWVLGASVET